MPQGNWSIEPFDGGDKEITLYAGDIRVLIDYDDVDPDEAKSVARFILAMAPQYAAWKAANKK